MRNCFHAHLIVLALLAIPACGEARYRVEGLLCLGEGENPSRIAILDSTASRKIQDIHQLYASAADSLFRSFADSLSAINAVLASQKKPIAQAERRLKARQSQYATTFTAIKAFKSFGGNAIFDSSDRQVPTQKLLEEIADRFYRGKSFSLEAGAQIRRMIREKLVPAEKRITRARNVLGRLRKEHASHNTIREAVAGQITTAKSALLDHYNRRVIDRLEGGVIRETAVDTTGYYRFDQVPHGRYHLYAPSRLPKLVEILVDGHRRIRILQDDPSPLVKDPA